MNKKTLIFAVLVILIAGGIFLWKQKSVTTTPPETNTSGNISNNSGAINAPIVVYKTKEDYRDLVSVVLSSDRSTIVAYPGPTDAALERPIALSDGYFIGQMPGAGYPDGAFLDMHIGDYSKMAEGSVSAGDLYTHVLDKSPFLEIYNCSYATTRTAMVNDINSWIATGDIAGKCGRVL